VSKFKFVDGKTYVTEDYLLMRMKGERRAALIFGILGFVAGLLVMAALH